MGIFDAQSGGIPLINTYQFQPGPGLPDISGMRNLLHAAGGRGRGAGTGGRASSGGRDDLDGLEGEVYTYKMRENALNLEKDSEVGRWGSLFMNKYNGDWDEFWDKEGKNIKNKALGWQQQEAEHEAFRQTMGRNSKRMEEARANKNITANTALIPDSQTFLIYGQKRDGSYGWGYVGEIVGSPMSGEKALDKINTHSVVGGEPVVFPTEYNQNKFFEELTSAFVSAKTAGVTSGRTSSGPYAGPGVVPDRYSPNVSSGHTYSNNISNIMNIGNNAIDHLSPEGRMSLFADTMKNIQYETVKTAEGDYTYYGVPDYEVSGTGEQLILKPKRDANGNRILLDPNNPEQHEAALRAHAHYKALQMGSTYYNYTYTQSEGFSWGDKDDTEDFKVGISFLAENHGAPLFKIASATGQGLTTVSISSDLNNMQQSLNEANPALGAKFNRVRQAFMDNHPAAGAIMNNANASIQDKNYVGNLMSQFFVDSGQFTADELDVVYARRANPTVVTAQGLGDRVLGGLVNRFSGGKFTLDSGDAVELYDNGATPLEAFIMMNAGIPVTIYSDLAENVSHYNNRTGYLAQDLVRVAGVGHGAINPKKYNASGLVYIAGYDLSAGHPWATEEYLRANQGMDAYKNWEQVPVYAGRGGHVIAPKGFFDDEQLSLVGQRRGRTQENQVSRKKIREFRQSDRENTYTLGSAEFVQRVGGEEAAAKIIQQYRSTYGVKGKLEDIKVTFYPAEVAITDPYSVDMGAPLQYGVKDLNEQAIEAIRWRLQVTGATNPQLDLSGNIRTAAPQPE